MKEKTDLRGVLAENPSLLLFLSACPALGATADLRAAAAMALLLLAVRLLSGALMSALRRFLPADVRFPAAIVITSAFTAAAQMLMSAYLPGLYRTLGVYAAVAAVDLAIYDEILADETAAGALLARTLLRGVKLGALLLAVGVLREALGAGSLAGQSLPFFRDYCVPALVKAPGGFLVLGVWAAVCNALAKKPGALAGQGYAAAAAGIAQEEEK